MKKSASAIFLILIAASCNDNQQTVKESRRDAIIDSLVAMRMDEIARQAAEDLDRRMAIEVKAKADSIFAVYNGIAPSPNQSLPGNLRRP